MGCPSVVPVVQALEQLVGEALGGRCERVHRRAAADERRDGGLQSVLGHGPEQGDDGMGMRQRPLRYARHVSMVTHDCPDDEDLFAFAEGLLPSERRRLVEVHIASCHACATVVAASMGVEVPQTSSLDRYQLRGELGRGGMGRVVRAHDAVLERDVAIKFLLPDVLGDEGSERFVREARALAGLRHPNVIEVFDIGESDGALFFVMELVEGSDLRRWAKRETWQRRVVCLRDAGAGLAAAHARGFLHRDFKPANVLVDPTGRARVGDFGLVAAQAAALTLADSMPADGLTRPGTLLGTLPYMAPELLDAKPATTRSDQFAYCVTAWEVLFGARPFVGRTVAEHRASCRGGPPHGPRGDVPPSIVEALQRGLALDPQTRFPSMDALLQALQSRRWAPTRVGWFGAAAVGLVGLAATAAASPHSPRCVERIESLAAQRSAARTRLRERGRAAASHEAAALEAAAGRLGTQLEAWRVARVEACDVQAPTADSDRLTVCLDRWGSHADRTLKVGLEPDTEVERLPALFDAIPDPTACEYGDEPTDDVPELAQALDEAGVRLRAHQWDRVAAELVEVEDRVFDGSPRLRAQFRLIEGQVLTELGDPERGMARLEDGFIIASRAGLDALAARNALSLVLQASVIVDHRAVDRWARYAHLHAQRIADPRLEAVVDIAHARGMVRRADSHSAKALLEHALSQLPEDGGTSERMEATELMARIEFSLDRNDTARTLLERHLTLAEAHYGPEHPQLRGTLKTLIELDTVQGVSEQTDTRLQRLRSITEQAFGEDDPRRAEVHVLTGRVAMVRQQTADALREFRAGLQIVEHREGEPILRLVLLNGVADAEYALGNTETALELRRRLVDEWTEHAGPRSVYAARFEVVLGELLVDLDQPAEGIAHLESAGEMLREAEGPTSIGLLVARTSQGRGLAALERWVSAQEVLEQALAEADPSLGAPVLRGEAMFELAKVLDRTDRPRAIALAREAKKLSREGLLREITAWLAER